MKKISLVLKLDQKMHRILQSDIYAGLNYLSGSSIDVCITSPPYWNQRNYGFDLQIGSERTSMDYISRLVFLFNILKEKLTDKGVFFLNIGDKYLNKYGKTPLGLIPYKLAFFMKKNGWILNDILIWYKPNHMPSSVKNRFVNSYEPVFVFSKNKNNYFSEFTRLNNNYSNIININLQPTPFKHVAIFPEQLVQTLLNFLIIDKNYTVLDPFAGSGTTLKVIDRNNSKLQSHKAYGIMIEYNTNYIDIIKKRIDANLVETIKITYKDYSYPLIQDKNINFLNNFSHNLLSKNQINTINIFNSKDDFYSALKVISQQDFIDSFPKDDILFIGLKKFSIDDIYNVSLLNNWILRNLLVVRENKWFPIFFLVHNNKTHKYKFNYKLLSITPKAKLNNNFHNRNFIGYKVENNLLKNKAKGIVVDIIEKYEDGLPKYVKVEWENGKLTKEFVIKNGYNFDNNICFYKKNGYISVKEFKEIINLNNILFEKKTYKYFKENNIKKKYNGKFNYLERKNWGASPGARSSVEIEYFAAKRLYNVQQPLIADYLNFIRKKYKLTKKAFTELFPPDYKHTVGHWLRKDFGGSIPVIEDWELLEKHFKIDEEIKVYACKYGLKLQTVLNNNFKVPDDVIEHNMIKKLNYLNS